MIEKRVDDAVGGIWFVHGERSDNSVDIACRDGDVFESVTAQQAQKLICARDQFLHNLYEILKD